MDFRGYSLFLVSVTSRVVYLQHTCTFRSFIRGLISGAIRCVARGHLFIYTPLLSPASPGRMIFYHFMFLGLRLFRLSGSEVIEDIVGKILSESVLVCHIVNVIVGFWTLAYKSVGRIR
ncbi:hypothetical protein BD779DRAFT_80487 [Infundibulicybe gibba]|nr:hypothetical protein BD779DRAFT_80487 [Infundibulicybe gibba]